MSDVQLFKDSGSGTITLRVGSEVAIMTIGEWSRMISRPEKATDFVFYQARPDGPKERA